MPIKFPVKCPQCGKTAENKEELDEKFGFRKMKDENGKESLNTQSWCKECRNKKEEKK